MSKRRKKGGGSPSRSRKSKRQSNPALGSENSGPQQAGKADNKKKGLLGLFAKSSRKKKNKQVKGKDRLKDRNVKYKQALDGGTANDVYKVKYNRGIGDSGQQEGFWKKTEGNEAAKSLASSRLDEALGTDVVSTDREAKHGKEEGVVSAQVEGKAMRESGFTKDVTQQQYAAHGNDEEMLNGTLEMMSQVYKRVGDKIMENETVHNDFDLENAKTQEGLANLQFNDYLTGQDDRHEGNIFIADDGSVKGIDNDESFKAGDDAETMAGKAVHASSKNQGLPQQVDAMTAIRFLAMTEAEFLKIISGQKTDKATLTSEEKAAALDRFWALHAHVDNLYMQDKLIWQWNEYTYDEAMEGGPSYIKRAAEKRAPTQQDGKKVLTKNRPNS